MKLRNFMKLINFKDKRIWLVVLFIALLIVFYILTQYNYSEGFLTCIQGKTRVNNAVAGLCEAKTDSDKDKARNELDIELDKYRSCIDYATVASNQGSNSGSYSAEILNLQTNPACISAKSAVKVIVDKLCLAKTDIEKSNARIELNTELEKYRTCGSSRAPTVTSPSPRTFSEFSRVSSSRSRAQANPSYTAPTVPSSVTAPNPSYTAPTVPSTVTAPNPSYTAPTVPSSVTAPTVPSSVTAPNPSYTAQTAPSVVTSSKINTVCGSAISSFNTDRLAGINNLVADRDVIYNSCPYQEYISLMNQYPSTTPYTVKSSPN